MTLRITLLLFVLFYCTAVCLAAPEHVKTAIDLVGYAEMKADRSIHVHLQGRVGKYHCCGGMNNAFLPKDKNYGKIQNGFGLKSPGQTVSIKWKAFPEWWTASANSK